VKGVEIQMSKALPTPTAQDIEAALTTMRNGTSAYGRWMRLEEHFEAALSAIRDDTSVYWAQVPTAKCSENFRKANAEADRLWWVTIIEPDGEEWRGLGGGTTLTEAAAVAWINSCIGPSWSEAGLSHEDDAKVPRQVPEGWQFELDEAPVCRPAPTDTGTSRNLLVSSEHARQRDKSPWSARDGRPRGCN
jgi:hypothetical protein